MPYDHSRGVNVLKRIARGSLWPLLLLKVRVCLDVRSVLKGGPSAEDGRGIEVERHED